MMLYKSSGCLCLWAKVMQFDFRDILGNFFIDKNKSRDVWDYERMSIIDLFKIKEKIPTIKFFKN